MGLINTILVVYWVIFMIFLQIQSNTEEISANISFLCAGM